MNYRTLISEMLLYVRSTQLVTDIRIQLGLKRFAILVVALAFGLFALVFFNVSGYLALELIMGPIWTPAFLGVINFILMIIALSVAASYRSSRELESAREIQASSLTQLNAELTTPRPLYGFLDPEILTELVPIISSLLRAVRKRRAADGEKDV